MQISGRAPELSLEQREKRKLAKRIIKAIQPALEDAIRKESELNRQPFEQELKDLDVMLGDSVLSGRGSEIDSGERADDETDDKPGPFGDETDKMDVIPDSSTSKEVKSDAPDNTAESAAFEEDTVLTAQQPEHRETEESAMDLDNAGEVPATTDAASTPTQPADETQAPETSEEAGEQEAAGIPAAPEQTNDAPKVPLSPPPLHGDQHHFLSQGGIQWYMQPFDPVGTTIHEERWTGREVMRGLSEELSELDEEELNDLVDDDELEESAGGVSSGTGASTNGIRDSSGAEQGVKVHQTRRRWRGFK